MILSLFIYLCIAQDVGNQITYELIEREKLAFIERSIVQIFRKGSFPEIFQAETESLNSCGCEYGTTPIYWGNFVGMMCKLNKEGYKEECGQRCTTPKGEDILLLCPNEWEFDCLRGCVPPPFNSVRARYQFLENNVKAILEFGHDYLFIEPEYLEACKCRSNQARLINYGTQMGFDCVAESDPEEPCAGFNECINEHQERIIIFCPAGHRPSCEGCVSTIADLDRHNYDERYDWAVSVLTGYIRESQLVLNIEPQHQQVVDCGCREGLQPVNYGNRIGYSCTIDNPQDINPECGSGVICVNGDGKELIHFCPEGFISDCEEGCGYWWSDKTEL